MSAENPKIGLDNVVIAKLLNDDGVGVPVYDTPIALKGAVQASVNPNSSVETDYADNGAFFVTGNRANTEMSLELTNINPNTLALMLGQDRANGITLERPLDQAPYFALGFRVWIGGTDANGNKIYEYFWYSKGKFSVPESGGTTKGESIDFQHISLTAQFVPTMYSPDGNGGVICSHARSDIDTASAVISSWFNAPVVATGINTGAVTVTIGGTTSAITITGSKSGGVMKFNLASATKNTVIILDDDGDEVPGAFTLNADGDVITFTPSETITSATVTVTGGLKDINGVGATPATNTI